MQRRHCSRTYENPHLVSVFEFSFTAPTHNRESDYNSKRSEMDTSPDASQKSETDNHSRRGEPASPSTPTKRMLLKAEVLTMRSEISSKSSSEKDTIIDQLKEQVIALARMSFSHNLILVLIAIFSARHGEHQPLSHSIGMENLGKAVRRQGICSLELSRRCHLPL